MRRALQALLTFLALGIFKANPRVSASPIPVYVRKIWKGSFFRVFFNNYFLRRSQMTDGRQHAESTTLHTTLHHSSSNWQHHVCMCAQRRVLAMLRRVVYRSLSFVTLPCHIILLCCRCLRSCPSIAPWFPQHPRVGVSASPIPVFIRKIWRGKIFPRVIFQFFRKDRG